MDHVDPTEELHRVIVRVLSGDLTEREEIALREWLDADPERRRLFHEMRAVWDEAAPSQSDWETTPLQKRIIAARQQHQPRKARRDTPTLTRRLAGSTRLLPIAAAITLIAGTATWFVAQPIAQSSKPKAAVLREVTTNRGQRATLQLPDGSRITLGPASTIRYGNREAELAGEAYFEVVHDSTRPFQVRTALGVARDLGTKFLVRAYETQSHVDVVVVEGLVSLRAAQSPAPGADSLLLQPRDFGRLDVSGNLGVEHDTDLEPVLAWARGQLVFRNAAVPTVVADLERTYDVTIRVADPLLRELRFSGSFGAASAAGVVSSFAKSIGATIEQEQGGFVLLRRGTQ